MGEPEMNETTAPALTVAVTGPTGTFGFGLLPFLQEDERIGRVVGVARRPFDPASQGWDKMEYRRGDVRDAAALEQALEGADVVVHLAFMITGAASPETIHAINVEGTLNAFRAARAVGAKRFVYASSVAAYGFHRDNPVGMTEEWPARPADRLFYAREKAELEQLLAEEAGDAPEPGLYLLRPPIVVGPHAVGAKDLAPDFLDPLMRPLAGLVRNGLPIPVPLPVPDLPMQFIHEEDVGQALFLCILGTGTPGVYNIAGDGLVSATQVARELGFVPIAVPGRPVQSAARVGAALAGLPGMPPAAGWVEALTHPAIMDTEKAKRELHWIPRYSGVEAVRDAIAQA